MMESQTYLTLETARELFKEEPEVEIERMCEKPGSGRGDNYTSMLYRLQVEGRKLNRQTGEWRPWQQHIIYKILPKSKEMREAYKSELLFRNEMAFYTYVWPALNQLQRSPDTTVFNGVAKIFAARSDFIAMEDLSLRGFSMADRTKGLELDRLYAVLKALAAFHALSLVFRQQRPDEFERLSNNENGVQEALFRLENEDWYRQYYRVAINNAITMVSNKLPISEEERREEIMAKLKAFLNEEVFFRTMCELTAAKGPLAVFCHGDCWTNNILFRTRSDHQQEVYLVDFQLCRVGSLALDLANLLYCCTSGKVRQLHMSELLRHYHTHLMHALTTLNPSQPQDSDLMWNLLNEEIRRCGRFGFGLALDILPISTCASDQAPDVYKGTESQEGRANKPSAPPTGGEQCARLMTDLVLELVQNQAL